jgi:predicted aldo/keto reductase-like oxidoreductase
MGEGKQREFDRRELLRRGLAGVVALASAPHVGRAAETDATDTEPRVRAYRELGRTGLRISDVSFGSSRTTDPDVVRHAFERGVNYFDTAEGYKGGRSEEAIGRALEGKRDGVFLASKVNASASARRDELMHSLEGSLRRLRTDHVDVYFNHAVNDPERLGNPEWPEFAERAKREGKLRFTGMSGHGGRLVECLDYALDHGLFDVFLVAYNFGQDPAFYEGLTRSFDFVATQPELPRVIARARESGVGVVAMKTLMGARLNDMRPWERGGTFAQAAFRWVLSSPNVDALVVSMKQPAQIDEYLGASGEKVVRGEDLHLLERYAERNGRSWCRHGCDACAGSCPHDVPIADVLRSRMYAVDYGDAEMGRAEYARLGTGAAACAGCVERPCLGACPHGLAIAPLTRSAHHLLG